MKINRFIPFEQVDLDHGFWQQRYELNKTVSMQNVRKRFEESGRFDALRFNFLKTGRRPQIFLDSDAAKWMEAVAYLSVKDPETMREHLALCEELIDCMEKAQRPDGYLNSTHQQLTPELIFQVRNNHELYCAGHLIEAAIAYHKATGKDRFLQIVERYCDCIYRAFLLEKTAAFITPGHEEIELALIALYRHTKKPVYLEMAKFFLEQRGTNPDEQYIYDGNRFGSQDDTDIRHLCDANGHCVRALYFYSGIADLAAETQDEQLLSNLQSVFTDIFTHKMYLTGGVGSTYRTESFTVAYDLPNRTAYNESCAAIALILFACRMREMDADARYGAVVERVLYNAFLSSTSLDGKSFFYENPLEIALAEYGREVSVPNKIWEHLPLKQRREVFECSCCPPNINRFLGQFERFLALEEDGHLTLEQYVSATIHSVYGTVQISEQYATEGTVTICSNDYSASQICLRIPTWSTSLTATQNGVPITPEVRNGYVYFSVTSAFQLALDFGIRPIFFAANPRVRADAGKVALTYGPLVMCLEGADNGENLFQLSVNPSDLVNATVEVDPLSGLRRITMPAYREMETSELYFRFPVGKPQALSATFIPYFSFANRGETDMAVWIRKYSESSK